jgi:hypothetical protein
MSNNKRLRVCFLTTIETNVGDDWIREGILYLLSHASKQAIEEVHINIHDWKGTILDENRQDKIFFSDAIIMAGTPFYYINKRKDLLRKIAKTVFSAIGQFTEFSKYDGRCSGANYVKPIWYDRIAKIYRQKPIAILAAGTNLSYDSDASELYKDKFIRKFVWDIHSWSRLNTVREPIAASFLRKMNIEHSEFPCTAFWAMNSLGINPSTNPGIIAFNYMPGGGHYRFENQIDMGWQSVMLELFRYCADYFGSSRIKFICHNQSEADTATRVFGSKHVWYECGYEKVLKFYSHARTGIVNRCHALVAMAGFGTPSVVVGKDSRTHMATEIGLPRYFFKRVNCNELFSLLKTMYNDFETYNLRLKALKSAEENRYIELIRKIL